MTVTVNSLIQMANEFDKYRTLFPSYEERYTLAEGVSFVETEIVPDHLNTKPYPHRE